MKRIYFYHLHATGHLYHLSEQQAYNYFIHRDKSTRLPSGPTHLKLASFLNFFFKQLKPTPNYSDLSEKYFPLSSEQQDLLPYFPYLNVCMGELNLLNVTDAPIVYHSVSIPFKDTLPENTKRKLIYAGSLSTEFRVNSLQVAKDGKIFHALPPDHVIAKLSPNIPALVSSTLAIEMGEFFEEKDENIYLMMNEKGSSTTDIAEATRIRFMNEDLHKL